MAESADHDQLKMSDSKPSNLTPQKPMAQSPHHQPKDLRRSLCTFLSIFLLLVSLTALILWLLYRPQNPRFSVVSTAVYDLNTTSPPFITTSLQFTLLTRNPNKRVGIIYEKLSAFVTYKNQPITAAMELPPLHHRAKTTVVVAPVLGGARVPVAAETADALAVDEGYGAVELRVVLVGRMRWKVALGVKTRRRGVYVKCDVWVALRRGTVGEVPLLGSPRFCDVHV